MKFLLVPLLCSLFAASAAQFSLKFDDPTHSVFHDPEFPSKVSRDLVFSLADDAFQSSQGFGGFVRYDQATNAPAPDTGVLGGYDYEIAWPSRKISDSGIIANCPYPDGSTHSEVATAFPFTWNLSSRLCISSKSTIQEDMADRISGGLGTEGVSYTYSSVNVSAHFRGGPFDGTKTKIPGTLAIGVAGAQHGGQKDWNWIANGDLFLQVDWGIDPFGAHQYYLFQLSMSAAASSSDNGCIPLSVAYFAFLGADPESYLSSIQKDLAAQINSGALYIDGPPPELLYLYDFSGKFTPPPLSTVPAVALTEPSYEGFTNLPPYVNQYDAGVAFNLPVRFSRPNPVRDGCTPGGNACGPTSMMMALNQYAGGIITDETPVYKNVMGNGLHFGGCSYANSFSAGRAQAWLQGLPALDDVDFDPPPVQTIPGVLYADTLSSTSAVDRAWTLVDQMLTAKKQPVVFRTDLGVGVDPGGGHMILILGKGHSDAIQEVWSSAYQRNLSGDYYVVADPAGHYFSNTAFGRHYNTVDNLRTNGTGVVYGGWHAVYPAELLRPRTSDDDLESADGTVPHRITALALGQTFGRRVWFNVRSPVSLIVTAPDGTQTGGLPDGTSVQQIPGSAFMPDIQDEEDEGSTTIRLNGPKSVYLYDAAPGTYHVALTGTGTGPYTFEWKQTDENGTQIAGAVFTGTVTNGSVQTYSVEIKSTAGPRLNAAIAGSSLIISWPASASGFFIEGTANPADASAWLALNAAVVKVNDEFRVTVPLSGTAQFFRLRE